MKIPHNLPYSAKDISNAILLSTVGLSGLVLAVTQTDLLNYLRTRIKRALNKDAGIQIGNQWVNDTARLRHTHIVGATGTGKTVLIEKLLIEDLSRDYGAIIIDPKGERELFERVKHACVELGRESDLYYLSATFPEESDTWNPCGLGNASELQTKFFNSAIYNEPHYAKACEFALIKAFRNLTATRKVGFGLKDLINELDQLSEQDKSGTIKGLSYDLNNLIYGEWEQVLGAKGTGSREVSLLDVISNNKILFVDLPTEGKSVQSSRIGRLLTQEIILISGLRKRNPALKSGKPFSVYIDEFDAFATESFASFLNKGRSSEFMIHLAHQTLSDLDVISPQFAGRILGNCNVRFIFRQDDPEDAERWARFIGTKDVVKSTYRTSGAVSTGDASNRVAKEFIVGPDQIKTLPIGRCVFSSKTEGVNQIMKIPFRKSSLKPNQVPESTLVSSRGLTQQIDLNPAELLPVVTTETADKDSMWDFASHPKKEGTS